MKMTIRSTRKLDIYEIRSVDNTELTADQKDIINSDKFKSWVKTESNNQTKSDFRLFYEPTNFDRKSQVKGFYAYITMTEE